MLNDLIARLEAAPEGSRELELEIEKAAGRCDPASWYDASDDLLHWNEWHEFGSTQAAEAMSYPLPPYTTSLDAALTLVPEGWTVSHAAQNPTSGTWYWGLHKQAEAGVNDGFCQQVESPELFNSDHHTTNSALALCIAALKARAAEETSDGA